MFPNLYTLAAHKQTFTAEVGDAMCGRKHMEGTPAECTPTCVTHSSKFALVVGEKIYILETSDAAALAVLDKQAGQNVTVTGVLPDDTIEVSSVTPKRRGYWFSQNRKASALLFCMTGIVLE
jgi:hypothetical protein